MNTSKIATIVYKQYTENVDMNNPAFKQSELNKLIKTDKDIIRVDYYIGGVLVGNRMYTAKQAIAQIIKMNATAAKLENQMEYEAGSDWYARKCRNEVRSAKVNELTNKIYKFYSKFITEADYNNSVLPCDMCMDWNDFIN